MVGKNRGTGCAAAGLIDAVREFIDALGGIIDAAGKSIDALGDFFDAAGNFIDAAGEIIDALGRFFDAATMSLHFTTTLAAAIFASSSWSSF